ncbi:serine hydrolase [Neorhizobium sp. NCHU2750]|uniref:serine hydrolase domain-containing protein n=1 Tax=Neorhizobium sp. NCHU2750 TaxID=1825976 RepID=UPI000EB6177C|nr:6-aminohexanoate hydrolase [Neorhizobium sp. NCHU2750]
MNDTTTVARSSVTLANWREAPFSRWSFQNVRELVPTSEISCGTEQPEEALASHTFLTREIDTGLDGISSIEGFLKYAHTDAFLLMKRGRIVGEYYAPHAHVNAKHLVFSISKSLTAILSGILEDRGLIDPEKPVLAYLPEAKGSAYEDCRYRDVLDMRVSLDFAETYLDRNGPFARYRRAMLWNPVEPGFTVETLAAFLMTLKKADRPHGGGHAYLSPNADLLGVVIECVTGRRYGELLSELLWKPMGARNHAYVTVDSIGTPRTAGGVCLTARDLARVGELIRTGGAIEGRQIIPKGWIADMLENGDPEAWKAANSTAMPNGRYRSQWYQTGAPDGAYCAIGIHGQWLYVDPQNEAVIVKLSSQPNPLDDELKQDNLAFFRTLSRLPL